MLCILNDYNTFETKSQSLLHKKKAAKIDSLFCAFLFTGICISVRRALPAHT